MNYTSPLFSSNELLSKLPSAELTLLHPLLTSVRLVNGQILYEAGERIEQVFFVQQGFISMVAEADGNNPGTEVGLVGCEGMVGLPVLLDIHCVRARHSPPHALTSTLPFGLQSERYWG